MRQDERAPFERALRPARVTAYPPGEFADQESPMLASEILSLGLRAGIGTDTSVLDVCCGVAGPGRLIAATLGCDYLGVDMSRSAIAIARRRSEAGRCRGRCRFLVAQVPPLPSGPFDVVLLLETMLAFPDKLELVGQVASALRPGGRFAFTLEEGQPLSPAEALTMPDADTVWLTPLPEVESCLERAGLRLLWWEDHSATHRVTIERLIDAFGREGNRIAARIGERALRDLLTAHRTWSHWLDAGRVRKLAAVAGKPRVSHGR